MLVNTELHEKVFSLISTTIHIPKENIRLENNIATLCVDSIHLFELLMSFENAFGVQAEYEDVIGLETVQDIIDYLKKMNIA